MIYARKIFIFFLPRAFFPSVLSVFSLISTKANANAKANAKANAVPLSSQYRANIGIAPSSQPFRAAEANGQSQCQRR
ncbi:MAG: hypothetical protein IKQ48_04440 [Paludibacteraceae bacterium]|nr:hypothetical protein [Paludibacteraceae bacterium]